MPVTTASESVEAAGSEPGHLLQGFKMSWPIDSNCRQGRLVHNIIYFSRALRRAGLPVGPAEVLMAVQAVSAVGFSSRHDFYWTLHACLVTRPDHRQVFGQVFRLFWRDPRFLEHMMSMMLPMMRGVAEKHKAEAAERRAADALVGEKVGHENSAPDIVDSETDVSIDAAGTISSVERLGEMDFEQMTATEMAEARKVISSMHLPVRPLVSRRRRVHPQGSFPDWRRTMRIAAANGGEFDFIRRRSLSTRWPQLVALCDISGSMSAYSRTLLHFLHTMSGRHGAGWSKVHSFTFGTTLTNITRQMRISDVDEAVAAAGREAQDWDGGTRIAECLRMFNLVWSRRVLAHGAIVLLITDGLESGDIELLDREIRRLCLASRRLVWINPLLRWEQFTPKARGVRTMLPHVDCFLSGHSINSLKALAETLADCSSDGDKQRIMERIAASETRTNWGRGGMWQLVAGSS